VTRIVTVPQPGLLAYFDTDPRRTRCPDCGRDLTRTASGLRMCAYAEDHLSGRPIVERDPAGYGGAL
jgi:hypothetical protein